jgi:pyrrolidone-carboxylate peptidase
MGGATPVPLKHRINVWLETVPALLKLLHVEYVSLMSHSAGTVYCLNTLYHLRDLLEPTRPYVAFIGMPYHPLIVLVLICTRSLGPQ